MGTVTITKKDFPKLCRLCLVAQVAGEMERFLYNNSTMVELYQSFMPVRVNLSDGLPQGICGPCIGKLVQFRIFRDMCTNSEATLQDIVQKDLEVKSESSDDVDPNYETIHILPDDVTLATDEVALAEDVDGRESPTLGGYISSLAGDASDTILPKVITKTNEENYYGTANATNGIDQSTNSSGQYGLFMDEDGVGLKPEDKSSEPMELDGDRTIVEADNNQPAGPKVVFTAGEGLKLESKLLVLPIKQNSDDPNSIEIGTVPMKTIYKRLYPVTITFEPEPEVENKVAADEPETQVILEHTVVEGDVEYKEEEEEEGEERGEELEGEDQDVDNGDLFELLSGEGSDPTPRKAFLCSCGEMFAKRADFAEHRKETDHERAKAFVCLTCHLAFTTHGKLKVHEQTHQNQRPYSCSYCGKTFTLKHNMLRHQMIHTGERPFTCEECGEGFIQKVSYLSHREKHNIGTEPTAEGGGEGGGVGGGDTDRPFSCALCERSFRTHYHCLRHQMKHMDEAGPEAKKAGEVQEYICEVCGHTTTHKQAFFNHTMTHHGTKSFLCDECGSSFRTKAYLERHQMVHAGIKPFSCAYCNKMFSQYSGLKIHTYIHTGEKPFVCKYCARRFRQPSQLNYHLLTHTGEKNYMCPYCEKRFSLNGNLTVHIRNHTGERPYVCDVCSKGFTASNALKKHKYKHHPEQV